MGIQLVKVSHQFKEKILTYKTDLLAESVGYISGAYMLDVEEVSEWITKSLESEHSDEVRGVKATQYIAIDETETIVGVLQLRHSLNDDYLLNYSGHIGYSIHPNYRRKGYATEMLRQAIYEIRQTLKLPEILLTCDTQNVASERVIIANGGILEDERIKEDGTIRKRFWIKILSENNQSFS